MMAIRKYYWIVWLMGAVFTATAQNKRLGVGDKIPVIQVGGTTTPALYGNGLLILNFWATWCAPCITEMETLADEVVKQQGKLTVLSIGYEKKAVVENFLAAHPRIARSSLLILSDDKLWNSYFFHKTLPHNVWVNDQGTITSITGGDEITHENISRFLNEGAPEMFQKTEVPFDPQKPMPVPDSLIEFRAIFSKRLPGVLQSGSTIDSHGWGFPNMKRYFDYNTRITHLFYNAHNMPGFATYSSIAYLVEVHSKDSVRFFWPGEFFPKGSYQGIGQGEWDRQNSYSYELRTPTVLPDSVFLKRVIDDLEFNLHMKTWKELRSRDCIVVTYPPGSGKISVARKDEAAICGVVGDKIVVKNTQLDHLLNYIARRCYNNRQPRKEPYLNRTGLNEQLNFTVELGSDKTLYKSQEYLEKCLTEQIGLKFEKKSADFPVLIIQSL